MKTFTSPLLFSEYLVSAIAKELIALHEGLEQVGKIVSKKAKSEIGHLQPATGPYEAWAELADSTKADKERLGYVFNSDYNPLLRTGELMASIHHQVGGLEVVIGSDSQIAVYQELGTSKIPPRSFLGTAAYHNLHKIHEIIGLATVEGLMGRTTLGSKFSSEEG